MVPPSQFAIIRCPARCCRLRSLPAPLGSAWGSGASVGGRGRRPADRCYPHLRACWSRARAGPCGNSSCLGRWATLPGKCYVGCRALRLVMRSPLVIAQADNGGWYTSWMRVGSRPRRKPFLGIRVRGSELPVMDGLGKRFYRAGERWIAAGKHLSDVINLANSIVPTVVSQGPGPKNRPGCVWFVFGRAPML